MPSITLRCRQCGRTAECEVGRLPPYGARARCAECGSLLPLTVPPGVGEASSVPSVLEEPTSPSRDEARQVLDLWIQEIRRTTPGRLTEIGVRGGRREELARLRGLWEASFPGPESARVFEEELQVALERLRSGGAG